MDESRPPCEANQLSDFPLDSFTIATFCESCRHQGQLDRDKVPPGVTVQQLTKLLRCSECGRKAGSIRIVYTERADFGTREVANHISGFGQEQTFRFRGPDLASINQWVRWHRQKLFRYPI